MMRRLARRAQRATPSRAGQGASGWLRCTPATDATTGSAWRCAGSCCAKKNGLGTAEWGGGDIMQLQSRRRPGDPSMPIPCGSTVIERRSRMRLFCVELTERHSAIIWAEDEREANEASARLKREQWQFKTGPADGSEMDPGSVNGD